MSPKVSSESIVRDIKRKTRRKFSSEEKIRIILDGLRGDGRFPSPAPFFHPLPNCRIYITIIR